MNSIQVRHIDSPEDLNEVIALQRKIWDYSDLEAEGRGILTVASRFAGQLLGAFAENEMVGFALSFVALHASSLHSHRVGVLPEYQNAGVGRALKLAQREHALQHGYRSIHWTFDPMQPRNAYLNLRKLGGTVQTLLPNLYGPTTSPLQAGLPTHRLLLDWDLVSERVSNALAGKSQPGAIPPFRVPLVASQEVPAAIRQQQLCQQLGNAFTSGLFVTGFEPHSGGGDYLLERL